MDASPAIATPEMNVQEFIFWHVLRHGRRALPVVEDRESRRLLGIVSVSDVKELAQMVWPTTPVGAVMRQAPLRTTSPTAEINGALRQMVEDGLNQLPVIEGGRLVGMLSRADVLRSLRLREELHLATGFPRRAEGRNSRPAALGAVSGRSGTAAAAAPQPPGPPAHDGDAGRRPRAA
jgi:predicted transcriptional regulator